MSSITTKVRKQQVAWAGGASLTLDAQGYTVSLGANLSQPLSPCARAEYPAGDGGELGEEGKRGKMQALHSSSALACNVFDHWRGRDTSSLASALGLEAPLCSIRFEQKFPTGLRGNAPNLDVVIRPSAGPLVAIESKFLEPYSSAPKPGFKEKYFKQNGAEIARWKAAGLPKAQSLASAVNSGATKFRWLDAAQLLKHALGLSKTGAPWTLMYLWYDPGAETGQQHRTEVESFGKAVEGDGFVFTALSYQELYGRLQVAAGSEHRAYLDYIGGRYFPAP